MAEIKDFNKDKHAHYPKEGELSERIINLISEYNGEMSTAAVLGILKIVSDYYSLNKDKE